MTLPKVIIESNTVLQNERIPISESSTPPSEVFPILKNNPSIAEPNPNNRAALISNLVLNSNRETPVKDKQEIKFRNSFKMDKLSKSIERVRNESNR